MDPFTLVLAGLALFFVFKLFSVLGTRTGHESHQEIEGLQRSSHSEADDGQATEDFGPDEFSEKRSAISSEAVPLRDADPNFDERQFLDGAKAAYEMIVEAFASGELKGVKRFLDGSVYEGFKNAAASRDANGQKIDLKFVGIENAAIKSAEVTSNALTAVVNFSSNQIRATYDRSGDLIDGDPVRIDLVSDTWTFSRPLRSSDPNWTLVATSG